MNFRYAANENFEDFAAGRVLYGRPGNTNFPVRLGWELFGRCAAHTGKTTGLHLYDPCCGGGYLLTTIALTNPSVVNVVGSDVDPAALETAKKNLSLLTREGRQTRRDELEALRAQFQKSSHREALVSLDRLATRAEQAPGPVSLRTFQADLLSDSPLSGQDLSPDVVLVDVPYGDLVSWTSQDQPLDRMMRSLQPVLGPHTVVGLVGLSPWKTPPDGMHRLEHGKVGKRYFALYQRSSVTNSEFSRRREED